MCNEQHIYWVRQHHLSVIIPYQNLISPISQRRWKRNRLPVNHSSDYFRAVSFPTDQQARAPPQSNLTSNKVPYTNRSWQFSLIAAFNPFSLLSLPLTASILSSTTTWTRARRVVEQHGSYSRKFTLQVGLLEESERYKITSAVPAKWSTIRPYPKRGHWKARRPLSVWAWD